jgi:hypothetical protein
MAETEPMNWSPLQCVITDAKLKLQDVGDGGSEGNEGGKAKVMLRGYGLGLKGRPPHSSALRILRIQGEFLYRRRSPARNRHHFPRSSFRSAL